jgi:hypothetical protein
MAISDNVRWLLICFICGPVFVLMERVTVTVMGIEVHILASGNEAYLLGVLVCSGMLGLPAVSWHHHYYRVESREGLTTQVIESDRTAHRHKSVPGRPWTA